MNLKTKKTSVVVISIVSLVCLIPSLLNVVLHLTGIQEYPTIEVEEVQTLSINAQIVCVFMGIILNSMILLFSKNFVKHKLKIILCTMILLLITNPILSGISLIVLLRKTKDIDEVVTLPKIEEQPQKNRILYICLFMIAVVINYIPVFNQWLENMESNVDTLFLSLKLIILAIACIIYPVIIMAKKIFHDFKVLKANFKTYMAYMLPELGKLMLIYFVVAIIIGLVVEGTPTNQQMINELPLWQSALLALLYAPIVEESLFRGLLRKGIKNDKVFVIISALVFGLIHVMVAEENILIYLYSITYVMIGYFLAKNYVKTNNIFANMILHCLWNAVSIISMILMAL